MSSTTDRAEINRRNGARGGPKTPEGKARSRFNALKHGSSAKLPVLPQEDPEAYRQRLDAWMAHLEPRNPVEQFLIEQAVTASWRLEARRPDGDGQPDRPARWHPGPARPQAAHRGP